MARALYGLWRHRQLPPNPSRRQSAEWLHESCARTLAALRIPVSLIGTPPAQGLIVSNHLSYLDIVVFGAAFPCVFVSKAEVEEWPIFGRYARWAGSVFVRRHDRADVARATVTIADALRDGVPVVLFPEGTTSNGHQVLRFHGTMLQPAIDVGAPITPAAMGYTLEDGDVEQEVCWWGDMSLLPHLFNLVGKKGLRATITFGAPISPSGDRKQLSHVLHDEVVKLRGLVAAS